MTIVVTLRVFLGIMNAQVSPEHWTEKVMSDLNHLSLTQGASLPVSSQPVSLSIPQILMVFLLALCKD